MRHVALITLFSLSFPAAAKTHVDKWLGSVDEVVIDGVVEVPLYGSAYGDPVPCVMATIGDKPYLLGIVGSEPVIYLGERIASEQELKVKSKNGAFLNFYGEAGAWRIGGEFQVTTVDSIQIGGLTLNGVQALGKKPVESDDSIYELMQIDRDEGVPLDGFIGMPVLEQLAYAVVPDKGVVRFAPAASGSQLLADVGGATLDYATTESDELKFGKQKVIVGAQSLVTTVKVGGQDLKTPLDFSGPNVIPSTLALPETAPTFKRGDRSWRWVEYQLGDAKVTDWAAVSTVTALLGEVEDTASVSDNLVAGDILARFDVAVDQANKKIALKPASEQVRNDPLPILAEAADKALQTAIEEAKKAEEEAAAKGTDEPKEGEEAKPKPEGDVGSWKRIAEIRERQGDYDGAIEALEKVVAFDDQACDAWYDLGVRQRAAGRLDDAIASFQKTQELGDSWWKLEDDERLAYKKRLDGEKKSGLGKVGFALFGWVHPKLPEGLKAQAPSCTGADAALAAAWLAKGDTEKVAAVYQERLYLDYKLAQVQAYALLADGGDGTAQEPLRQAVKLERSPNPDTRAALGLAYTRSGDLETADGHFQKALERAEHGYWVLGLWAETLRESKGQDEAFKAVRDFAAAHPDSIAAHLILMREAQAAGRNPAFEKASKTVEELLADSQALYPRSAQILAADAYYRLLKGDVAAAAKTADDAVKLDPGLGGAWWLKGQIALTQGNTDEARQSFERAVAVAPYEALYPLLDLKKLQ